VFSTQPLLPARAGFGAAPQPPEAIKNRRLTGLFTIAGFSGDGSPGDGSPVAGKPGDIHIIDITNK
jgi:hypothetical protein